MALQPGDRVTLSINPTVQLADYQYAKPHASLTREVGDSPEETLSEMQKDLHALICRAMAAELGVLEDLYTALEGGKESLIEYCLSNLNGVTHGTEGQDRSEQPAAGTKRKPRRKART